MKSIDNQEDSFQAFYSCYFNKVKQFLMKKGMKLQDAEDLSQEAFQYCYKNWDRFDPQKASRKTWLFLVVSSRWKNYCRDRKIQVDIDDYANQIPDGTDLQQAVWVEQIREEISAGLAKLPENQRRAVVLRHIECWDCNKIAKVLGISEGNARILIYRGLRKLEKELPEDIRRTMSI